MKLRLTFTALVAAASGPVLAAVATAGPTANAGDARVAGTFAMHGRITRAVDVRGERPGMMIRRTWRISGTGCDAGGVCARLRLVRERPGARSLVLTLDRVGPGRYRGSDSFSSPLRCLGRTYARGLAAPYTVTLEVTRRTAVGSLLYATGIRASYLNPARTNRTPCPLAPASDAARYLGRLVSALPAPPVTTTATTTTATTPVTIPAPTTTTAPGSTTTTTPLL